MARRRTQIQSGQPPMLRGGKYRATHQASVDAILGAGVRRVYSRGGAFYNRDFWPLRIFVVMFCALISRIKRKPTFAEVADLVNKANGEHVHDPHIVIASTPEKLLLSVALALIGGAYHESWHTLYSRRAPISARAMWDMINTVWDKISEPKAWARMSKPINDWANIVEDIRIERCGNREFPGAEPKMHDLQHFILEQEQEGHTAATHRGLPEAALNNPYSIISGTFRDVGLGYNTERQRRALDAYRERNNTAVDFVLDGPLSDLLRESISLGPTDDTDCLRIAMEVLVTIHETAKNRPEDGDGDDGGGGGEGESPQTCPNCGASKKNLKVQPKSDGKGGTVKGKGIMTCKTCGYEEEVDLSESGGGKGGDDGGDDDGIEYDPTPHDGDGEGGDESNDEDGDGEGDGDADDGDKDAKGKGKGDEDGDEDGDENEGSSGGKDGDEDGDEDGKGKGDDDNRDSDGDGDEKADASSDPKEGTGKSTGEDGDGDPKAGGTGAGGYQADKDPAKVWEVAVGALDEAEGKGDTGLVDNNDALKDAFGDEADKADKRCKGSEQPFRPWDRTNDSVDFVRASGSGKAADGTRAALLLSSVKAQCSYLRARLRNIVRAAEQTTIEHGVRRGKDLSERQFVDSRVAMMGGRYPSRAYYVEDEQVDTSLAAVTIMDQSSSMMGKKLETATKAFMALTEPLDALNAATMAIGFRDGSGRGYGYAPPRNDPGNDGRNYHRYHPVHVDVFKNWNEKFQSVKWRFANTRAVGGTPMAEGVQFALEALSERPEAHRVVFVVTDGMPNNQNVVRHQCRIARESGILVVGVGVGSGASYVRTSFPDHVYAKDMSELPQLLIAKLNQIMDFRGLKRGRRLKATG